MSGKLPNPSTALGEYLDEMLHRSAAEVTAPTQPPDKNREPSANTGPGRASLALTADPQAQRLLEVATPAAAAPPGAKQVFLPEDLLTPVTGETTETAVEPEALATTEPDDPAREDAELDEAMTSPLEKPQSGEQTPLEFPLQCLMFRVDEHLLSIPLMQLSGVLDWDGKATRLPESPSWMTGLIQHRDRQLRIADSRQLLSISSEQPSNSAHLLVLAEGDWAITCDQLEQVVDLELADVQWKSVDAQQFVLGTIRETLSSLLSPAGILQWLNPRDLTDAKPTKLPKSG